MHYSKQKAIFKLRLKFTLMASSIMMLMAAVMFIALGITMYNQRLGAINDAMASALDTPYQIESERGTLLDTSPWDSVIIKRDSNQPEQSRYGQYTVYVYSIDEDDGTMSTAPGSLSMLGYKEAIASDIVDDMECGSTVSIDSIGMYALKSDTRFGMRVAFTSSYYLTDYMANITETLMLTYLAVIAMFIGITTIVSSRLIDPIEKAWNEQDEFIQNASHELRTPIAIVKANMDILRSADGLPENAKQYIGTSIEAVDGMNELVNDLLYFTTSTSRKSMQIETANVSKLVEKACFSFDSVAIEKSCMIDSDGIAQDLMASVDVKSFSRVMSILLDNACKYCDKGTTITVKAVRERHRIVIDVNDYGTSIRKGDEEVIFDRFYRSDKARLRQGGYGLGLAMARELVESMDGEIKAGSTIEGGTTFTVSIPAAKGASK